jgi:hypothetical protein
MSLTYDFTVPISFDEALDMFSAPRILDAIHGQGLWSFGAWQRHGGDGYLRRGTIDGVLVPSCARALNGGKAHITCTVKQRYVPKADGTISFISTLKPRLIGAPLAKNKTWFSLVDAGQGRTHVRATAKNTCYLPPPLSALAKECMNQSTDETIACLREACE